MKHSFRIILAAALCALLVFSGASAAFAAEEAPGVAFPQALRVVTNENGYGVHLENAAGERAAAAYPTRDGKRLSPASLPARYDSRDLGIVTSVKDQGETGICWAFSTVSAMETNAIKQGLADVNTVDYSESHLAWFGVNSSTTDKNDLTYGDGERANFRTVYQSGGNSMFSMAALSRGTGLANESDFNLQLDYAAKKNYNDADRYVSELHLAEAQTLDCFDDEDAATLQADVKAAIMEYGAVTASYYSSLLDYYYTVEVDGERSCAYYQDRYSNYDDADHMVCVVGWDDNYSVRHFSPAKRPRHPGAWIIKNSWGTDETIQNSVISLPDGYVYISYEDPSLCEFVAFTAMEKDAYNGIYQYDGYGYSGAVPFEAENRAAYANVFTATEDAFLSKVGFYTAYGNEKLTVNVYNRLADANDPESGTLVCSVPMEYKFAGYHTVDIPVLAALEKGKQFSVVIKAAEGAGLNVPLEINEPMYRVYGSKDGQSFVYAEIDGDKQWYPASDLSNRNILLGAVYSVCNVPVKAMTVSAAAHTHTWGATQTMEPTCTLAGGVVRLCSGCDAVDYVEQIPATGHSDANGDYKCDVCGVSLLPANACPYCHKVHGGGFDQIIAFFHRILYLFRSMFSR